MWESIKECFVSFGNLVFGKVPKTLIIAVIGIVIIRIIMILVKRALEKGKMEKAAHNLIKTLVRTILWILLLLTLASSLGIDVTGIVALVSVVSLAISLALQNMLANIVGGFTLLYTRPFSSGDFVEIASQSGRIKDIGVAYTRIVTLDNKVVSIPNSAVVSDQIINYTTAGTRRLDVNISASYNENVEKVEEALKEAAMVEGVLSDPAPFISVAEYGESSINYVVRVWVNSEDYWDIPYDILHKVKKVFDERGIEMTYPHLNVHLDK